MGTCVLSLTATLADRHRIDSALRIAFASWSTCSRAHSRVVHRWGKLARAAEMEPSICDAAALRLQLRQRSQRMQRYYRRGFWRCEQPLYHKVRLLRGILMAWRMLTQNHHLTEKLWASQAKGEWNHYLAEELRALEGTDAGLRVSEAPWWRHE